MIRTMNKDIINSDIIGKAYLVNNNKIITFLVLFEHRQILYAKYFVRNIHSSKNAEIEFLEKNGYKTIEEWNNKFNNYQDPVKSRALIKRKNRKKIINSL